MKSEGGVLAQIIQNESNICEALSVFSVDFSFPFCSAQLNGSTLLVWTSPPNQKGNGKCDNIQLFDFCQATICLNKNHSKN